MKLVPKLTLAFIAVTVVIHAQGAYRRVVRESRTYSEDRDRDVTLVAKSMADAAAGVWHAQGEEAAQAMIVHVSHHDESVHVRWVCEAGETVPPGSPLDCGSLARLHGDDAGHAKGAERRFAYAPVVVDGVDRGAIEVSASLAPEDGFVQRTIADAAKNNLINNSILLVVSFFLGVWLVARPTRALMEELVRGDFLRRTHLGLDFFDASINRVAAWVIGARSTLKALLQALLEPIGRLRAAEEAGDGTTRLALLEECKTLPFGAVWEEYCRRSEVPGGAAWLGEVKRYEAQVLSRRG